MEKPIVSPPKYKANQSQEFIRSSDAFYPSPSSLIGESDNQIKSINPSSQGLQNPSASFKSPYDIEENQFNNLFNCCNDDYNKDNNLRNESQKKKMMDSNSLIKQKYVTFILDNEGKSNPNKLNNPENYNNMQKANASKFLNRHETFNENGVRVLQSENKNISNIQSRYLKTSNVDQRSARKSFLHPSAASTAILNRKLATAKSSQRKKDNLLDNSMFTYPSNS